MSITVMAGGHFGGGYAIQGKKTMKRPKQDDVFDLLNSEHYYGKLRNAYARLLGKADTGQPKAGQKKAFERRASDRGSQG